MKNRLAEKDTTATQRAQRFAEVFSLRLCGILFFALFARAESVRLAWDPNPEGSVTGYYVYRSQASGGPYSQLNNSPIQATYYLDDSAETRQIYFYKVMAVSNSDAKSAFSNIVQITTGKFDVTPRTTALVTRTLPNIEAYVGDLVILSGSAHNPENKTLCYLWTQPLDQTFRISGTKSPEASFLAPLSSEGKTLTFTLTTYIPEGQSTCDDPSLKGQSTSDTLQVTIHPKK